MNHLFCFIKQNIQLNPYKIVSINIENIVNIILDRNPYQITFMKYLFAIELLANKFDKFQYRNACTHTHTTENVALQPHPNGYTPCTLRNRKYTKKTAHTLTVLTLARIWFVDIVDSIRFRFYSNFQFVKQIYAWIISNFGFILFLSKI